MKKLIPITLSIITLAYPVTMPGMPGGQKASAASTKFASVPHDFYLDYGRARITVKIRGSNWKISHKNVVDWVKDALNSICSYYGRFPLTKTVIYVNQTNDSGVGFATASYSDRHKHGVIKVNLGKYTEPEDLTQTWTLTHEMVHLTFPLVHNKYNWLTEGIATYVEPIGRMRQRLISKDKMWKDLMDDLPQGQPEWGDRGLNNTHTWGRTYWGGALFSFVADVRLRQKTNNKLGLEDALRGIMNAGATAESNLLYAPAIIKLGDKATGTNVLSELYNNMKDTPVSVNLPLFWRRLGLSQKHGKIYYDDSAPLSHIRKSIESGKYNAP